MKNGNKALRFIILLGLVSLFSDMTYEAARSINGPFLEVLGANAFTVGLVAGLGELLGYGLRLLSGWIADRTRKYWLIVFTGYALNLFSVPLLALAGYWQIAVVFILLERIGKAVRSPSRDALLSFATQQTGRGWGYGLHEAMDQIGATLGPLFVSSALFLRQGQYSFAYALLVIPAVIAMSILAFSRYLYPAPEKLEVKKLTLETGSLRSRYWIYLAAVVLIAAGYADFPLIAFHFKAKNMMADSYIPLMYALAMITDAISALAFGRWFDRRGIRVLVPAVILSLFFAPLVFLGDVRFAVAGMILWGIGMGVQESVMKAQIAVMIPPERRGAAFGTFHAAYGLFWFGGSTLMGYLYNVSLAGLVSFSVVTQLLSVIFVFLLVRKDRI
ncbi:MAG: MFS transporter [Bacteroidales bacterium]